MPKLRFEDEIVKEHVAIVNERLPEPCDGDYLAPLSDLDKSVYLVLHFDGEVLNDGMEQWLKNPIGYYACGGLVENEHQFSVSSSGVS
jgi:hypothetical protein